MSEEISREEIAALLARESEEMTREELRDYVEEQRSRNSIPYHVYSALIDGIDTLEQEPICPSHGIDCEDCPAYDPCGDAISRQAALGCCRNEWEEEVEIRLKSLPPVTPMPKTGHLIEIDAGIYNGFIEYTYRCSCCDNHIFRRDETRPQYCEWCGARMESEDNG